jgi:hypothetical protein
MSFWIVPESLSWLTPCSSAATMYPARAPAIPPRSSSSTRSCGRAGCRRTGSSCPRPSRSPPPPCRHRRPRADDRCRNRDGWRGRRRSTAPSAPPPNCRGRTGSIPRRSRSRNIAGSSTADWHTWSRGVRANRADSPASCRAMARRRALWPQDPLRCRAASLGCLRVFPSRGLRQACPSVPCSRDATSPQRSLPEMPRRLPSSSPAPDETIGSPAVLRP